MQNGISQQSPNPPLDRISYIAAISDDRDSEFDTLA